MKKILLILCIIILSSCDKTTDEDLKKQTALAPLENPRTKESGFSIDGKNYKLPLKYDDFKENGIHLVENDYYKEKLNKDEQLMVNFRSDRTDFGGSLKNNTAKKINTKDALITEVYINSSLNEDFEVNGLKFGDDYSKALAALKDYHVEEASAENEKNINYQTESDYISLYFTNDKLVSAAIFSKNFMRDKSYVEGEFVVFGQSIKFPDTLSGIEDLLGAKFTIDDEDNKKLKRFEEHKISLHSPLLKDSKANDVDFVVKNISNYDIGIKDAQIIKITSDKSLDLSVGNIFLGQDIDELKIIDKQNQNPQRMSIDDEDDKEDKDDKNKIVRIVFDANNDTQYVFYTDGKSITKMEVIYRKY